MLFYKILEKAKEDNSLSKEEIIELLESKDNSIYNAADEIRKKAKGNNIHLRALIEFTNFCRCNCFYCGLRYDNHNITRYRLTEDEILISIDNAIKSNYKTIVLQGGEDMFWSKEKLCNLIKKIKEYDVALTLSIGERPKDEYKAFKDAGADRFLLRIETTDKTLYRKLHPNMSFENRLRCLKDLKELGFETGTGCIVGLPNQTISSLADDILFFKELNADMVGIGPFIPHPNTPLANEKKDNFELSLKVMAITRLLLPDINIPATTAMETLRENGQIIALQSGANVIMPSFTTSEYKKNYEIYPNKKSSNNCINNISEQIKKIGRSISHTKGFRKDSN